MSIPLELLPLLDGLVKKGWKGELQKETDQIALILTVEKVDFPLFIRILPQGPMLQLIVFIPCTLQSKSLGDLARVMHLFNREMDIPGFGIDENAKVAFYRVTLPALEKRIELSLVDTYLRSIEVICRTYTPALVNVATGKVPFASILEKANQAH